MRKLTVVLVAAYCVGCGIGNPTNGEKIGTLIRVAQSGVLCKTWEATIVRGGFSAGSGAIAQPYDFTITSKEMADRAVEYMETQQEVKLTYQAEGVYSVCRSDSAGHFAQTLQPLQAK